MMVFIDFFIIYLACGTPFGVYYFLNHRFEKYALIKSISTALLWIPYSLHLIYEKYAGKPSPRLMEIQKYFETELPEHISIFQFRETIERYSGLCQANAHENHRPTASETELMQISAHTGTSLGAKCLHRRNRTLLRFHQKLARRDLLFFFNEIVRAAQDKEKIRHLMIEYAKLLKDESVEKSLAEPQLNDGPKDSRIAVSETENELRHTGKDHRLPLPSIPSRVPVLTAKVNSSTRD